MKLCLFIWHKQATCPLPSFLDCCKNNFFPKPFFTIQLLSLNHLFHFQHLPPYPAHSMSKIEKKTLENSAFKLLTQSCNDQDSAVLVLNVFLQNQFYLRSVQLLATDSGPRPRPRFQSWLVVTDWQSSYLSPKISTTRIWNQYQYSELRL